MEIQRAGPLRQSTDAQLGLHSTPLLDGDRLYFQYFIKSAAYVIALDKANGKEIWKVERKSDGTGENLDSYASPMMWRKGKDAYLITHGNDYAIAHRLEDGSEIWRVGGLNPKDNYRRDLRFVASPVATPDLIVIPSAKDHGVVGLKPDAKGLVDAGQQFRGVAAVQGDAGRALAAGLRRPRLPVPRDGSLLCLDAKTGKELYDRRIHASRYRASPVAADGNVYLTARDGAGDGGEGRPELRAGGRQQAARRDRRPRRRRSTAASTCAVGKRCTRSERGEVKTSLRGKLYLHALVWPPLTTQRVSSSAP